MNAETSMMVTTDRDSDKAVSLRRTKLVATMALLACFGVFLAARAFETTVPWLAYVAAFAEAATIGGLADWYAVVALYRRPLGLPIPHTAIIPANKDRIADNLGRFIEVNFLATEPVRKKLHEVDFAQLVADWLSDRERSAGLSRFVARLVPQALGAVEQSGLRAVVARTIEERLESVQLAPLAADMLGAFTADRRHQSILDGALGALGSFLNDEAALDAMRDRIRKELPSLANFFRADAYLLKKIVVSASSLIKEVGAEHDHPMRREFDRFAASFIEDLRTSPAYAERAERLKRDLLARPELRNMVGDVWSGLRNHVENDLASETSVLREHLASMLVEAGRALASDERIRADMNHGFVIALTAFVERQKSGVATFISDQVRGWDIVQLTRLVELNIGRDLQYIRFNGMLIGGLAGLALHVGEKLLLGP